MLPADVISSLSRSPAEAESDLVASRVGNPSGSAQPWQPQPWQPQPWQPPAAIKNAVSDGLLLGTGAGTGWRIQTNGDVGHLTLSLQCSETQKKTAESVVTIRSYLPGLWKISYKPGFSESTYSSLTALIQDFRKLEQTRLLSPCLEDTVIQLPKVTTYVWVGARFLGADGVPNSSAISPGLIERNQRALVSDSRHVQPVGLSQPHLRLWNVNSKDVVGNLVDSNIYFLCSLNSPVAYCSYSVEDLLEQALVKV
jgi:hypothetical protein